MHALLIAGLTIGALNMLIAAVCAYYMARIFWGSRKLTCPRDEALRHWSIMLGLASIGYVLNEARWIHLVLDSPSTQSDIDELTWSALETCWLTGSTLLARAVHTRECEATSCNNPEHHARHLTDETDDEKTRI